MITVAAPNYQLTSLQIDYASLARISDTFRNLRGIQFLILENGALETLSLDPFVNSPQLLSLGCSVNRISQLIPSRNASLILPITDLMLAYNLLESISGDFFRPLHMLQYVTLDSNRIQCIEGSPISLPRVRYISLVRNQLSQLDVSEWHVPRLIEIYLESNNLTRVPAGIERLPNLTTLVLQNNLLKVVDLRRFDGWTKLIKIDLSGNRLRNVIVSGTGRISLPNVVMVHLTNNQLTHLEYARWDFPQLTTLTIALNEFQRLPDLFQIFPKLKRVLALHNPLHCSTVRQWEQYIVDFKLSVDTTAFGMPCITNAMLKLPSGRELCCVE
ncbi:leucine-rich repeat protein SHOC-2-like [Anopheles funestus]|uniref:leucine-rich repeat protein SHOC-2-like n=1 Tax=Anopheles funestus TaxID=62324 RepID=UPI0020C66951|nr:leucine-rich repeat protein SHOC-2-like [Anopheles funestus]